MNEKMKRRIKNAERTDHLMTGVFCAVGGSFLLLILVLAGYIIIKGIMSYFPGILAADSGGIGNQLFNTVYLVVQVQNGADNLSVDNPSQCSARSPCGNLHGGICRRYQGNPFHPDLH